jgi:myo-inositol-1(or 4)-monophosphatase
MDHSLAWQEELGVARAAAQAAGGILGHRFGRVGRVEKKGTIDLVTEADIEAEKAVLEVIQKAFPEDYILSEEAGARGTVSDRRWLIDPLDGTTNFAHGFPFFAVSIALEVETSVVLGVVYNPYMNEFFEAVRGRGSYLNGKAIRVSETATLKEALLGTGFPYDVHQRPERVMHHFTEMIVRAQGVRRPGSAALDLCYVAAGRLDGFWEEKLHPWDTAAGAVIVEAAGGLLSTYEGAPYEPHGETIVAANPALHRFMLDILGARV